MTPEKIATIPREVVFQSLGGVQPEVCPYYIWIAKDMVEPLAAHYGEELLLGQPGGACTIAGSYTAMTEITSLPVEDQGEYFVDEYEVKFRRGSILQVKRPALAKPSLSGYTFPDLSTDEHFRHLRSWAQMHASRFRIVQLGMLFFERSWYMRGMENLLADLHMQPSFVDELFDGLEVVCNGVIDRLLGDYSELLDAVGISDDCGSERSMLLSPKHWRRFIKPRLAHMCERIHRSGKLVYIHSCGHITPIIPDLIEIGVDMLQPIQPECMDIFDLKRRFGKDICMLGGISTQKTLPYGTPQEVRREVQMCLEHMAVGGRYVMAPAKAIMPGVPVENAIALIDTFINQ